MRPGRAAADPSPGADERIVDVVFGTSAPGRRRRYGVAVALAIGLHTVLGALALGVEPSLESWSSALALRVHTELSREGIIELPEPPRPAAEKPPQEPPEPPPERVPGPNPPARSAAPARPARAEPPPPARAGRILAHEPDPLAPVDMTASTFVVGEAAAYAGGVTTARGTNETAVRSHDVAPPPAAPSPLSAGEPDRSAPVGLPTGRWSCPWPTEADDADINEQTVVIRVDVRPDGTVASATLVDDPGHGFGTAALACARRARFTPARDERGQPIASRSPPVRVRFHR